MARPKNPMRQSWLGEGQSDGWIAHRLELLVSSAWRHRPVPLIRILERIEIEHLRHGGAENGRLVVTFDQFVAHGISRRVVFAAITCGERLGLIEVRQTHEMVRSIKAPNEFRLTYVPEKDRRAPTDEWASVVDDDAKRALEQFRLDQSKKSGARFPFVQPTSSLSCTKTAATSSLSCNSPVTKRELLYISGGKPAKQAEPTPDGEQAGDAITAIPARANEPAHVSDALTEIPNTPKTGEAGEQATAHPQIEEVTEQPARSHHPQPSDAPAPANLTDGERSLLRWLIGLDGPASHRKAQQNLSRQLSGDLIFEAAANLAAQGLISIEEKGRTRIYAVTGAGQNPALLDDQNQFDLLNWLEGQADARTVRDAITPSI